MIKKIEQYFEFVKHKTNWRTEILAGISTFLSLSYIFVVNPSILSEGGINKSAALFATVIVSAIATIIMGWWAKKPFALAPGLEMNSYVVYFLILGLGVSWQGGLGAIFWSGIIFLILTITNVRTKIIDAIPDSLKVGLAASVGIFIIIIALRLSDVFVYTETSLTSISLPFTKKALVLLVGFLIAILLKRFKIKAFILISIVASTILAYYIGLKASVVDKVVINQEMFSAIVAFDLTVIFNPKVFSAIIILFVIDFYGSIAKFIGLTQDTSILNKEGKLPNIKEALLIDGGATVVGSALGTTSITTFVESGIGIGVGGRTGVTAIVSGLLMLLFIPLAPLVNLVPVIATTGALLWVGFQIMPNIVILTKSNTIEIITVILMIVITIFTFALDKAMLIGFSFYVLGLLFTGQKNRISIYLIISILLILIATILSTWYV